MRQSKGSPSLGMQKEATPREIGIKSNMGPQYPPQQAAPWVGCLQVSSAMHVSTSHTPGTPHLCCNAVVPRVLCQSRRHVGCMVLNVSLRPLPRHNDVGGDVAKLCCNRLGQHRHGTRLQEKVSTRRRSVAYHGTRANFSRVQHSRRHSKSPKGRCLGWGCCTCCTTQ